ncbi:hypothetical protein EB796_014231 [Bugula neritina]|uniref:Uncharacterized protein n=1 Tax=Bugula neritina TaxID=10212 RepID=A0A7J7JM93_BUGNE|nr:hypothetical protein EB796_014231 [Bugula neritina]
MKFWKYGYHLDLLLELTLPVNNSVVKSVLFCCEDELVIGTKSNSIILYNLLFSMTGYPRDAILCQPYLEQGVGGKVVCTLSLPQLNFYNAAPLMVAGTNGTFIFYDTIAKISIGQFALKDISLTSVAVNLSHYHQLCLGTLQGKVIHLKLEDNFEPQLLCETCVSKGAITHLSYSPAGNMLAAVSGSFLFILVEHFNEDLEEKVWVASEGIQVVDKNSQVTSVDWSVETLEGAHLVRVYTESDLAVTLASGKVDSDLFLAAVPETLFHRCLPPLLQCSWCMVQQTVCNEWSTHH